MPPLTRDRISLAKNVDLLTLIGDDTHLRQLTQDELAGPCPFCGGTDRFHLQPHRGRWFCRQCTGEPGDAGWMDAIDYVQRRHGLSFREAVAYLNNSGPPVSAIVRAPPPVLKRERPLWRSTAWQSSAWSFVRGAQRRLNSAEGQTGQNYLLGRSILPTTWQTWGLGLARPWHPLRRQHLPAITLPWQQEQRLCAVQYRFIEPGQDKSERFCQRKGGQRLLFGTQNLAGRETLLLVEGELNALSLWQVVGDRIDVLSCGPQGNIVRSSVLKQIVALAARYQRMVVWTDDEHVARQAVSQLQATGLAAATFAHAIWSPQGLDANDLLQRDLLTAYIWPIIMA